MSRHHPYQQRARRLLGGICVSCASKENLTFDHIDPATKRFTVADNWSRAWHVLWEEIQKCQLLCRPCHQEKSRKHGELGGGQNRWTEIQHGKLWAYSKYGCRCEPCRAAKRRSRTKAL